MVNDFQSMGFQQKAALCKKKVYNEHCEFKSTAPSDIIQWIDENVMLSHPRILDSMPLNLTLCIYCKKLSCYLLLFHFKVRILGHLRFVKNYITSFPCNHI